MDLADGTDGLPHGWDGTETVRNAAGKPRRMDASSRRAMVADLPEEPIPPRSLSRATAEDCLDSWKEIASYLRRGVRTVKRWEKEEGLPVHRHQHQRLGSVYAY